MKMQTIFNGARGAVGLLWIVALMLPSLAQSDEQEPGKALSGAIIKAEFLYDQAPFPSCHASTIVETTNQTLVAAWFGGTAESAPDVGIYLSRYERGHWTAPVEVADGVLSIQQRYPCYNPVLFQPKRGPLMLFYKVGPGPQKWWGMLMTSKDQGRTWTRPWRLPEGILGPIKNKPIQLADGSILCPSSTEAPSWRIKFERTADLGHTWTSTEPLNDGKEIGAIQPSVLSLGPSHLHALGRTQQGRIFSIDSTDGGQTWGTMKLTQIPNPNSGIDATKLQDGRFLLVYNATEQGRTPLNVALSSDSYTWHSLLALEDTPGEYSYPAVIQTHDGKIHITYTWNRKRIRHIVLDPHSLKT